MCNLSDAIYKEGIEKGLDGQIKLIEVIMQGMNKSFEEALSISGLSEEEKNAIRLRFRSAS